ncbi:unnamed protein product [Prorocentrum cordatum]|uniref:AAA+ ATPase domain-containing protein n=1 Tax=Prorocentrum cordatum TaxID=2364126 RepID=A0ABN9RZP7_9DINO|nr:unnamed protein product [Polarella glacialis]
MGSSFEMSQASRILVVGAGGSGKSTLVKVLIGKLKLTEGAIQRAVGIRVAYVCQHVFRQLEDRMHMTPLQYMMWRFAGGNDRESAELQRSQKPRLPTREGIEQHCSDFGVDQESVNRLHIKQLNKSMRFRLVLSAAMWPNPNLLVLDEPASCLDHCSLEALAAAIEAYKGGVLITAHTGTRTTSRQLPRNGTFCRAAACMPPRGGAWTALPVRAQRMSAGPRLNQNSLLDACSRSVPSPRPGSTGQ